MPPYSGARNVSPRMRKVVVRIVPAVRAVEVPVCVYLRICRNHVTDILRSYLCATRAERCYTK
jgi:hypothetical protein